MSQILEDKYNETPRSNQQNAETTQNRGVLGRECFRSLQLSTYDATTYTTHRST